MMSKKNKIRKCIFVVLPAILALGCQRNNNKDNNINPNAPAVTSRTETTPAQDEDQGRRSEASNEVKESSNNNNEVKSETRPLAANSAPEGLDPKGILDRIHDTNTMEIKMGELAVAKGSLKSVKQYGDMLKKDHAEADKKVTDVAKKENITLSAPTPQTDLERQKMEEHKALMTKLRGLNGKAFDEEFTKAMINGHNDAIAFLEASNSSDENVKALVSDILPTIRNHERTALLISQELHLK